MPLPHELRTPRLILRRWRGTDLQPFAAMNADPRVMEYFPSTLTVPQTEAMIGRINAHFEKHGFGFWALEVPGVAAFAGFVGLGVPPFEAPFTPCVEIGWRLAAEHWGRGYATEAARAALAFAFDELELVEVVALTVPGNFRSRRVMEKLGMTHDAKDDFDHPLITGPLRRQVLYRIHTSTK